MQGQGALMMCFGEVRLSVTQDVEDGHGTEEIAGFGAAGGLDQLLAAVIASSPHPYVPEGVLRLGRDLGVSVAQQANQMFGVTAVAD
jgi:hypothetical protein